MKIRLLPNRHDAPLMPDERVAEQYLDQPARLMELAEATGNRALRAVALGLLRRDRRPKGRKKDTRPAFCASP